MDDEKPKRIDPDMVNATSALIRASKRARLLAAQTGTEFVVMRDGKLVSGIPKLDEIDDDAGLPLKD
ncbi:MAG: hypothetical protein SGJ27_23745 [Candidatus Melainabacteria bacterium]|nr:hypothetical protein [Candidatus Melainabacteria bacterium]